ncbi:hypothetical protein D3C72_1550740 [compost metagenome]
MDALRVQQVAVKDRQAGGHVFQRAFLLVGRDGDGGQFGGGWGRGLDGAFGAILRVRGRRQGQADQGQAEQGPDGREGGGVGHRASCADIAAAMHCGRPKDGISLCEQLSFTFMCIPDPSVCKTAPAREILHGHACFVFACPTGQESPPRLAARCAAPGPGRLPRGPAGAG